MSFYADSKQEYHCSKTTYKLDLESHQPVHFYEKATIWYFWKVEMALVLRNTDLDNKR